MREQASAPVHGSGVDGPLLELSGITKRYGALTANDDITLAVASGEVVAMLGENGAGKSTLMKIVYGLVRPDGGTIRVAGKTLDIGSPRDAMAAGIGMVTQEFSLVETMTVTENIALSGVGLGRVRAREIRTQVVEAMDRVGVSLDPDRLVSALSIGERQRVEIVKALFHDCRVLILDEPTAVLTPQDVRALFATIERLSGTGLGVLFVSHKLREVAEISSRVVVLRRGRLVGDRITAEIDAHALAGLMMGTTVAGTPSEPAVATATALGLPLTTGRPREDPEAVALAAAARSRPVLSVSDVTLTRDGRTVLDGASLDVRPGEILGVAGISGNGQTELMSVLCGTVRATRGSVAVDGVDVTSSDVAARLDAGLGRLTEDRRGSVLPQMSVEYNLVVEDLARYTRRGFLDKAAMRVHAESIIERFDIRARSTDSMSSLSGGNVQKVLLARALARAPRVLVVAQPTRGLDVGAYRYVHSQLQGLRDGGAGVLVISEDLDELHALCDRIIVLFRGRLVGDLDAAEATNERLGAMMTGETVSA
ncbi:MAG: ABC transporter ATP-binding protein [Actinomycetota bacterium]|nr:ABC transporter ATP-binding protein [Actinomycetota bacterium]